MARTQASNTQASKSKSLIGFFVMQTKMLQVFQTTWKGFLLLLHIADHASLWM